MVWDGSPRQEDRTPHSLKFHILDAPVSERFDCGEQEQNRFLLEHAWSQQQANFSKTYLAYLAGILCGYVTLAQSEIKLAKSERPETALFSRLPATKLAQMGVDLRFRGYRIGDELIAFALITARRVARRIGGRYVILDALPHLTGYYERRGFVINDAAQLDRVEDAKRHGRALDELAISMRFDMFRPSASEL